MPGRALAQPDAWRGALWAASALRTVRRQLRTGPLDAVRVPAPTRVSVAAGTGANAVLRRARRPRTTCLQEALVRQAWYAARGDRRDLVVAVGAPVERFGAHAWLAGDPEDTREDRPVLLRRPAP